MATQIWNGTVGVNGDGDDALNWTSAVPGEGDTVIFPSNVTQDLNVNADFSAADGTNFVKVIIQAGVTYDLGADGAPFACTADLLIDRGGGATYFKTRDDIASSITDEIRIEKAPGAIFQIDGDEITSIKIMSGRVTIKGSFTAANTCNVIMSYRTTSSTDATLNIIDGTNPIDQLDMWAGTVDTARAVTILNQRNGLFTMTGSSGMTTATVTGGHVIFKADTTTTNLHLTDATFDMSEITDELTVAAANLYSGARFIYDPNLVTVTVQTQFGTGAAVGLAAGGLVGAP